MRSAVRLGAGQGFVIDAVTCADDHRGWSAAETSSGYRVVLVRQGRFRRMADGRPAMVDPTMAYLGVPGEEEHFAHPAGGDVCTSLCLSAELWRLLAGAETGPVRSTLYVDARLDLTHRRLLTAARGGDGAFELTEALLSLLSATLAQATPATGSRHASSSGSTTAIVDAARESVVAGAPAAAGLLPLAESLAVSPYQLSRAFTRELGVSLTHYRNRVRVGQALDRLENGEPSLALLAADLGFADQAHLTRTIRRHVGHTPSALRRLLTARDPGRDVPAPVTAAGGPAGAVVRSGPASA
ncbi:helix-turn-helix domain-containing protein [Nonomuraea cavernae]|uniref:helix-turn-helix domain-containing protein n=1 Tax=Nonomuraea cavernae TaxID=2045107 RepID=UPI0033F9F64F